MVLLFTSRKTTQSFHMHSKCVSWRQGICTISRENHSQLPTLHICMPAVLSSLLHYEFVCTIPNFWFTIKNSLLVESHGSSHSSAAKGQRSLLDHSTMASTTASFLDLPPEVRLGVYRYLFLTGSNKIISPLDNSAYHDLQPAILRTCKLIEEEARAVLYRENTFIHIIHDLPLFEIEYSENQLSLLGKHHPQQFPAMCSLEVSIITKPDTTTEKHHIMIASEDLELICTMLCIVLAKRHRVRQTHMDMYLDFSESVNAMKLSTNRQDELLLPFKKLHRASSITVRGAINRRLATEVQDAPLKSSSMSSRELMKSDFVNVMRLPLAESIMRMRQEIFGEVLATNDLTMWDS